MLLIAIIVWVAVLPLIVLTVTELGWRIGERLRSRRLGQPRGAVVRLADWRVEAGETIGSRPAGGIAP